MARKQKKEIYGYNMAGMPITSKFEDYRGYVIQDHQHGKVTVASFGRRYFAAYKITSVDQAKRMIDAWEEGKESMMVFNKMAEIAEYVG